GGCRYRVRGNPGVRGISRRLRGSRFRSGRIRRALSRRRVRQRGIGGGLCRGRVGQRRIRGGLRAIGGGLGSRRVGDGIVSFQLDGVELGQVDCVSTRRAGGEVDDPTLLAGPAERNGIRLI